MENIENGTKTVDVIIPVYHPDDVFKRILMRLGEQTYPIRKIILMNTEKSYWDQAKYQEIPNLEVHHVTKQEFDHGGTRNKGASYSKADIMVFMTDDALPANRELIHFLVQAFQQTGKEGEKVVAAYARQLPNPDCALTERFTRSFNYSVESKVKTKADLKELGIKTFFSSNVCCAYDRVTFVKAGGFINRTIFNEDMIYAGNAVRYRKEAIAYVAEARVIHSHNYGCLAQLKRNFDLGVSQADHPEVFSGIQSEREGIRLVKKTCGWLINEKKPWLIPGLLVKSGFKYLGYLLGKRYRKLPKKLINCLTMNRSYWKEKEIEA